MGVAAAFPVVHLFLTRLAMASEAENSVQILQRFQTIVAMTSELDLSILHPPMAEKTPFPLHKIIQWDMEGLRRVARWKASEEAGKDIVRAYSKVVLALQELETASQRITMHGSGGSSVPPEVLTKQELAPPPAVAAVVLKSAVKSRRVEEVVSSLALGLDVSSVGSRRRVGPASCCCQHLHPFCLTS